MDVGLTHICLGCSKLHSTYFNTAVNFTSPRWCKRWHLFYMSCMLST